VEDFNLRRRKLIAPGAFLCIDELMSSWEGRELKYHAEGMPHVMKIARKPKGVGCEVKCIADCFSGIMMGLEIQQGKSENMMHKFADQYAFHIAITLRLSEPWFHSFRTLIADSAFASVETAQQLMNRGLYLEGCIKTATRRYPMKYFKALDTDESFKRGDHRVCKTTIKSKTDNKEDKEFEMYAICWKDKVTKYFIGTCGSTTQGQPHIVQRTKVVVEDGIRKTVRCDKSTNCPTFVNELFEGFNAVDLHDRYRQDILGLENHWETHH
jgi:hypothetical protein